MRKKRKSGLKLAQQVDALGVGLHQAVGVWKPPQLDIVPWPPGLNGDGGISKAGQRGVLPPAQGRRQEPNEREFDSAFIIYPLPPSWRTSLAVQGETLIEQGQKTNTTLPRDFEELRRRGWKRRENADGLLADLWRLVSATPTQVKTFILNWGPLWLCDQHPACLWNPRQTDCHWQAWEKVGDFRHRAVHIRALLRAADRLRQGEPVDFHLWHQACQGEYQEVHRLTSRLANGVQDASWPAYSMRGARRIQKVATQRQELARFLTRFFLRFGPALELTWEPAAATPEIRLDTGLGFLPLAYYQLLQFLAAGHTLATCPSCEQLFYPRQRRYQRTYYCDDCQASQKKKRKTFKASKRRWAQDHPDVLQRNRAQLLVRNQEIRKFVQANGVPALGDEEGWTGLWREWNRSQNHACRSGKTFFNAYWRAAGKRSQRLGGEPSK